jgi:hypothetical protein
MIRTSKLCQFGALALSLSLAGTVLAGHKQRGYVRTLDDLRLARMLLQRSNPTEAADESLDEISLTTSNIDNMISEINQGIGADRKKTPAVPQINTRLTWPERLTESLRLIQKAKLDCSSEKEKSGDDGLRFRILTQLEDAQSRLTVAVETVNFEYDARSVPTRND